MTALVTIPAIDNNFTMVAGQAGKIVVVRHILAAAATSSLSCTFRLKSDSTVLTPWLRTAGSGTFQWDSQRGPIQTAAGESLKGDNPLSDGAVVLIVYELVNA
jgi:hypothetical protein